MECWDKRAKFDILAKTVFSCRMLHAYVVTNFLFMGYFFLCRVYIVGMGASAVEGWGGALLCDIVISNMKFLDFLDLS